jgi:hypothetical protein
MRTCEQIINEMSYIPTPFRTQSGLETYLKSLSTFELKSLKEGIFRYKRGREFLFERLTFLLNGIINERLVIDRENKLNELGI